MLLDEEIVDQGPAEGSTKRKDIDDSPEGSSAKKAKQK